MAMNMEAMLKITANVAGENNIRRLGNSMQGLEGRIKNASMATNLLYTGLKSLAAVAVTGGVVALAKSAIDLADDMRDLSQRTGVGKFKVAAELSGSSLEGVAKGLTFLNKNMVAAATGTEAAAAAFKTIGVATTEADGTLRKADKVFLDVADRFAQLRDGPEKAALAIKIFGKSGAELIPILNLGSKEIQRFGLGIGPDFANKADAFNDQLGLMKAQTTVLTVQIGSALLPVMSGLVSVVTQAITFLGNLASEFYTAIGGAAGLQQVAAGLIKTMVVLGGVTAGVFIATNITNFTKALGALRGLMLGLLSIERATLAVQTARAAVLSLIAGLQTPGPAQAKALGVIGGGAVGLGLAVSLGKLIDDLMKKIGTGIQGVLTMPNIPTPPPGTTPDLSGLRTGTKPKKEADMSERMYRLRLQLNDAEIKGENLKAIGLRFDIAALKYEESKLKTRQDAIELADAEKSKLQAYGDVAAEIGSSIARDFLKRNELQQNYQTTIEDLQIQAGLLTAEEIRQLDIKRTYQGILEKLPDLTEKQKQKILELVQASKALKEVDFGKAFKESLQDAYKSATNLGAQLGGFVASGIDKLTNSIVELATTGKASFQELAATALKELGSIFLKYALFKALFGIFPGLQIGLAATGGATGPNSAAPLKKFASGGVMSGNGIVPMRRYANGGIARSPEVALYGERGPEAYVPLPDGRTIPVKIQQRNDVLNRYKQGGGGMNTSPTGMMASDDLSSVQPGGAIDVRYTVERINSVDYVTADQFQRGMQQAASQGAARGEQRALATLRQNTTQRRRIGL
jgi:lambda family phage tail tape measure protein